MPLRDHFHPPVNRISRFNEILRQWTGEFVRQLSSILPNGYRAAPRFRSDSRFEETDGPDVVIDADGVFSPTLVVEADLTEFETFEVRIHDATVPEDRFLVAAIEIVSPSNKDRPGSREVFAGKVLSLLQQGVCVSLIDLVTVRKTNLYGEVLNLIGVSDPKLVAASPQLYAVSLRGRKRRKKPTQLEAWYHPLAIGEALPTLPIWLSPELHILLPLEASYEETCRVLGIG